MKPIAITLLLLSTLSLLAEETKIPLGQFVWEGKAPQIVDRYVLPLKDACGKVDGEIKEFGGDLTSDTTIKGNLKWSFISENPYFSEIIIIEYTDSDGTEKTLARKNGDYGVIFENSEILLKYEETKKKG